MWLVHEKIEREASSPKEMKTNLKTTIKRGWNKKKYENGKSKLEWLECSDTLE